MDDAFLVEIGKGNEYLSGDQNDEAFFDGMLGMCLHLDIGIPRSNSNSTSASDISLVTLYMLYGIAFDLPESLCYRR